MFEVCCWRFRYGDYSIVAGLCKVYFSAHGLVGWLGCKCDPICEKGSYSFSNCICLVIHNLTFEYGSCISLQFDPYTPG